MRGRIVKILVVVGIVSLYLANPILGIIVTGIWLFAR